MLREEGGGGVEEGSRATCVETNGVRYCTYVCDSQTDVLSRLFLKGTQPFLLP